MKVQVAHITATDSGVRETDLGVQVRAVKIDLATILVDDIAHLLDTVLEHPIGGGVRDLVDGMKPGTGFVRGSDAHHERRKIVFVLLRLCTEVYNVEIAIW